MCIPPVDEEPALHFALLAKIAARNGLARISMGMSADYETAVRLGATHVRVGSALFGARPPLATPSPETPCLNCPRSRPSGAASCPGMVGRRIVRLLQHRRDLRVPLPAQFAKTGRGPHGPGHRPAGEIPADPAG